MEPYRITSAPPPFSAERGQRNVLEGWDMLLGLTGCGDTILGPLPGWGWGAAPLCHTVPTSPYAMGGEGREAT